MEADGIENCLMLDKEAFVSVYPFHDYLERRIEDAAPERIGSGEQRPVVRGLSHEVVKFAIELGYELCSIRTASRVRSRFSASAAISAGTARRAASAAAVGSSAITISQYSIKVTERSDGVTLVSTAAAPTTTLAVRRRNGVSLRGGG
jgi:hypothetical protein